MNLYRLDSDSGPVSDLLGPVLIRKRTTANTAAKATADDRQEPVTVTRISGAGLLKVVATYQPQSR